MNQFSAVVIFTITHVQTFQQIDYTGTQQVELCWHKLYYDTAILISLDKAVTVPHVRKLP